MSKESSDIQMGEAPALLFVPGPLPADGEVKIPPEQILVVAIPPLYLYVRDLVIADQAARRMQQNNKAVAQMMDALLQFKPPPSNIEEEGGLFNFEEFLEDGRVQKDE